MGRTSMADLEKNPGDRFPPRSLLGGRSRSCRAQSRLVSHPREWREAVVILRSHGAGNCLELTDIIVSRVTAQVFGILFSLYPKTDTRHHRHLEFSVRHRDGSAASSLEAQGKDHVVFHTSA